MTGATGVIGRRLIALCTGRGHQVTALARSPAKRAAVEKLGATAVTVDLFDREALARAMPGHDAVVNLATHIPTTARMLLPGAWRENDRIRREGSAAVSAAARTAGVGRLVQESFAMVYPDHGDAWIDETMPIAPSPYNRTVADAEQSAARFTDAGGAGVVLRFAAFYGPDSRFLGDLARAVARGFAPLPGSPQAYLSSVSHDDAAAAALAALELPAGIYNVADAEPLTHRDFVDSLADALGVHHPRLMPPWLTALVPGATRAFARSIRLSNRKLAEAGWSPRFRSVRDGWPTAVTPFVSSTTRRAPA